MSKQNKNQPWNKVYYQARMVDKSSNPAFARGVNDVFLINPKEIASTLVLDSST